MNDCVHLTTAPEDFAYCDLLGDTARAGELRAQIVATYRKKAGVEFDHTSKLGGQWRVCPFEQFGLVPCGECGGYDAILSKTISFEK